MATIQELEAQLKTLDDERAELVERIADAKSAEQDTVLSEIVTQITLYGIPIAAVLKALRDAGVVEPEVPAKADKRKVSQPKYKDPNTNATWTGRGKAPAWLAGKERERFLIGVEGAVAIS